MDAQRQKINCPRATSFEHDDWDAIRKAFDKSPTVYLRQHWLSDPQEAFYPARVRTAWTNDALLVFAELQRYFVRNKPFMVTSSFHLRTTSRDQFHRPSLSLLPVCWA
jgi:hypothetical protein